MNPNEARVAANLLRMQQPDSSLSKPGMAQQPPPIGIPPVNPQMQAAQVPGQPQAQMPQQGQPQGQPQGGPMGTPPIGVPPGGPPQQQAQPPQVPANFGGYPRTV